MIALLQRVVEASVSVDGAEVGRIGAGLLVFLGVRRADSERESERLLERVLAYRVFSDGHGRMNRSLRDLGGGLLVVPQFTLCADTRSGRRPSFSSAADPDVGRRLYEHFVSLAREAHHHVETGRFAAPMVVGLVNDGPVTFWLEVSPGAPTGPRDG